MSPIVFSLLLTSASYVIIWVFSGIVGELVSNNDGNRVSKTEYRAERLFQDHCFPGEVTCWTFCNPSIILFKIRQFEDAYWESD